MSNLLSTASIVVQGTETVSFGRLLNFSAVTGAPGYLVVNGYDRNEYAGASAGLTGSFVGNGQVLGFSAIGGDARGAGIVFAAAAGSGRYYNSTFGFLDQLDYRAAATSTDVADLSVFGTNDAALARASAGNAITMAQRDASGFAGTLTVAVASTKGGAIPTQATPLSIAATAQTFVGATWNANGCWVLASLISAEAGASLPVQSAVNMAGAANGEWVVAYNGPAGAAGDWAAAVRTGDVIGFVTAAGTGHITTCVAGAGSTATLIDNVALLDPNGTIRNKASDGAADHLVISAAHDASREWAGVAAKSVVIYRLDTPVVTTVTPILTVAAGATVSLSSAFAITDPASKPITSVQAYTANSADWFTVAGATIGATSAASAVTAASLSQISFDRGASDVADTVSVRAYNGSYWGDWTTISTSISPTTVARSLGLESASGADGNQVAIHRFFDKTDGTHFFTASASEATSLAATRSDLSDEGIGLRGYGTADASGSSAPVFRFFNLADGTHFYTASATERDGLLHASASTMKFEGTAFYEDLAPRAGDTAVYRFFDTAHGTHLFTQSASEKASILSSRPDLVSEGIAFYAPS